jgi:prefoldin alpha subunit
MKRTVRKPAENIGDFFFLLSLHVLTRALFPSLLAAGKDILVPLTESLYVPGKLHPEELVLVDIGTNFYVGKTASAAKDLLLKKAGLLRTNTETLYKVITEKREHLDVVQEELERRQNSGQ